MKLALYGGGVLVWTMVSDDDGDDGGGGDGDASLLLSCSFITP